MNWTDRLRLWLQQIRDFVIAGLIATLAHYAAMGLLITGFEIRPLAATFVGSWVGSLVAYGLNRVRTFRSQVAHRQALPRHLAMGVASIALNAFAFEILVRFLTWPTAIAQIAATAICLMMNFVVMKFWVFRGRSLTER